MNEINAGTLRHGPLCFRLVGRGDNGYWYATLMFSVRTDQVSGDM